MVSAPASINCEPKRKERCRSALIMRHCPSPSLPSLFPAICSSTSFLHRISSPRVLYTRIYPLTDIRGELFEHHPSATGANGVNDRWKIDAALSSEISLSLSLCVCNERQRAAFKWNLRLSIDEQLPLWYYNVNSWKTSVGVIFTPHGLKRARLKCRIRGSGA